MQVFVFLQIALLEATLTKEALQKISDGDWSSLDNKHPPRDFYYTSKQTFLFPFN